MKCLRCLRESADVVAKAPDGSGAWEVYYCTECNYSWRNNETEEISVLEKRDAWGQLDKVDFNQMRVNVYRAMKKPV